MAINTSKVVVAGLAAGVVSNILGFLVNGMLLGKRMEAEMVAAAPTLAGKGMGGGAITARVISQFIIGILLVWIYAAIRPRFGPGMGTAVKAALVIWVCGLVFFQDWYFLGMMSAMSYVIASCVNLVVLIIAAWVGGRLYTEDGTAAV